MTCFVTFALVVIVPFFGSALRLGATALLLKTLPIGASLFDLERPCVGSGGTGGGCKAVGSLLRCCCCCCRCSEISDGALVEDGVDESACADCSRLIVRYPRGDDRGFGDEVFGGGRCGGAPFNGDVDMASSDGLSDLLAINEFLPY